MQMSSLVQITQKIVHTRGCHSRQSKTGQHVPSSLVANLEAFIARVTLAPRAPELLGFAAGPAALRPSGCPRVHTLNIAYPFCGFMRTAVPEPVAASLRQAHCDLVIATLRFIALLWERSRKETGPPHSTSFPRRLSFFSSPPPPPSLFLHPSPLLTFPYPRIWTALRSRVERPTRAPRDGAVHAVACSRRAMPPAPRLRCR